MSVFFVVVGIIAILLAKRFNLDGNANHKQHDHGAHSIHAATKPAGDLTTRYAWAAVILGALGWWLGSSAHEGGALQLKALTAASRAAIYTTAYHTLYDRYQLAGTVASAGHWAFVLGGVTLIAVPFFAWLGRLGRSEHTTARSHGRFPRQADDTPQVIQHHGEHYLREVVYTKIDNGRPQARRSARDRGFKADTGEPVELNQYRSRAHRQA